MECTLQRRALECPQMAQVGRAQAHALRAWEEESDFRAAIEADPEISAVLRPQQIDKAFSLERQLRNIDKIFARVFGE